VCYVWVCVYLSVIFCVWEFVRFFSRVANNFRRTARCICDGTLGEISTERRRNLYDPDLVIWCSTAARMTLIELAGNMRLRNEFYTQNL